MNPLERLDKMIENELKKQNPDTEIVGGLILLQNKIIEKEDF